MNEYLQKRLAEMIEAVDRDVRQSTMTEKEWTEFQNKGQPQLTELVVEISVVECLLLAKEKGISAEKSQALIDFAKRYARHQPTKKLATHPIQFTKDYLDLWLSLEGSKYLNMTSLYRVLELAKYQEGIAGEISRILKRIKSAKSQGEREYELKQGHTVQEMAKEHLQQLKKHTAKANEFSANDLAPLLGKKVKSRTESIRELIGLLGDTMMAKSFEETVGANE